jgi:hypothetical protein
MCHLENRGWGWEGKIYQLPVGDRGRKFSKKNCSETAEFSQKVIDFSWGNFAPFLQGD